MQYQRRIDPDRDSRARSPMASDDGIGRTPTREAGHGPRGILKPGFWYTVIAAVAAVGLALAVLSIP